MAIAGVSCTDGEVRVDRRSEAAGCRAATEVTAPVGRPGAHAIAIVARDDRFDPSCVEVESGGTVTLVVRNEGNHPHNLSFRRDRDVRVAVDAGQVGFLDVDAPGSGDVRFVCTIHDGMDGVLRVAA